MMINEAVGVIGLGYVGLPLAVLTQKKGYQVLGFDSDKNKVDLINNQKSPFYDVDLVNDLVNSNITATDQFGKLKDCQIVIVCVPTPVDNCYMPDLGPVKNACKNIANNIVKGQLIIIESTINPGVCEEIVIPLIEKESGLKCGLDFDIAHCPERINPGDTKWNVGNIARVVGGYDDVSLSRAVNFYESIIDAKIKPMDSIKEAEAVKVVENSFRDVNIAFVNELAMSFDKLGINIVNVIDGAATKPFSFMAHYPGAGVGGHCIPVDPYYLIEYAKLNGFNHRFLSVAREINNSMPKYVLDILQEQLNLVELPIKNQNIAVLGLSYKPNVGDLRESPSLEIIELLNSHGANVIAYDPYISELPSSLSCQIAENIADALENTSAIIVATAHDEFVNISPAKLKNKKLKVVIDGRNCLDKASYLKQGFKYHGIGQS